MGPLRALAILLLSTIGQTEYRVFHLKIERKPAATAPGEPPPPAQVRYVDSTLDPWQYGTYYPVAPDETVTYTDTWRCYGRTDFKPLCPSPRASSAQGPETAGAPASP